MEELKKARNLFLALTREIHEELGIVLSWGDYDLRSEIVDLGMKKRVESPRTYTGLLTCYRRYFYQIFIDANFFQPTYVETQIKHDGTFKKSVHFSWMTIETYDNLTFDRD